MLALLLACAIDNTLGGKTDGTGADTGEPVVPPVEDAQLGADPAFVSETACADVTRTVTLTSQGTTPLTISAIQVQGEGWTVGAPTLPVTLDPGQSVSVEVTGRGSADLVVESDDVDSPTTRITLDVVGDYAPTLSITAPTPSATLEIGTTEFVATVSDDVDAPEALALTWSSSVDGAFGADPAASDGFARASWNADAQSAGDHTVTLTAVDSCGNVSTTEVSFCQQAGYVSESLDLATWNFEGSARWDSTNGWVELTTPSYNQAGTAFQTAAAVSADNVNVSFAFFVSGGSGADGISVTALDVARMTGFVGSTGGGIGYMGMPGWSVEIDTWYNGEYNDPTPNDHISVHVDGNASNVLAWAELPEMEDGLWHTMDLSVTGTRVTAAIDGTTYIDQDVPQITPFSAYVGFTAATGGSTNYHLIDALEVTELSCPE
jgi:hypothetical protein